MLCAAKLSKIHAIWSGNTTTILCQSENERIPSHPKHTHIKKKKKNGNSLHGHVSWTHTKGNTSDIAIVQPAKHTHLPAGIEGVRTHASIDLLHTSAVVFCLASIGEWRHARSIFSGGSTLDGTPGGDRWARVLGGQIGWLSEFLHRVDADCFGCTNLKMGLPEKQEKFPPHRLHTMKPTSAQRPRPPRDGARKTTSHALAHNRPLT